MERNIVMEKLCIYSEKEIIIPEKVWVSYCKKWIRKQIRLILPDNVVFCENFEVKISESLTGMQIKGLNKKDLDFLADLLIHSSEKYNYNNVVCNEDFLYLDILMDEVSKYIVENFEIPGKVCSIKANKNSIEKVGISSGFLNIYPKNVKISVRLEYEEKIKKIKG